MGQIEDSNLKAVEIKLPEGFTPLSEFVGYNGTDLRSSGMESGFKTAREHAVTNFAGVVRRVEYHLQSYYPKVVVFLNAQETFNNSGKTLDFPVSIMQADMKESFDKIEISEGDTLVGIGFGILVRIFGTSSL